jgi:hypothetical protein
MPRQLRRDQYIARNNLARIQTVMPIGFGRIAQENGIG